MMTLADTQHFANDGAEAEAASARGAASPVVNATGDALRELVREAMLAQGLSQEAVAQGCDRSATAINQWLKGKYKGDVAGLESDLQKWLALNADVAAMGAAAGDQRFVDTPSAAAYLVTCRYAQAMGKIDVLYGSSGMGKTTALEHYASLRNNVWLYAVSPAEKTLVPFLKGLARAMGIANPGSGASDITRAIIDKAKDSHGLIIVDEADHLSLVAVEQLRFVHDRTRIGIVLAGNDTVYGQLTGGTRRTEYARLFSRIGKRQKATCTAADIAAIAEAMGVRGRDELAYLKQIGTRPGHLRNVAQVIQQAGIRATGKGETLALDHLETAWTNLGAEV